MAKKKYCKNIKEFQTLVVGMGCCYASDRITVDGLKVGYMYREEPDNEDDSGWRFFGGDESKKYTQNLSHFELHAVNSIANFDPEIIPHLHAPVNSAFERSGARKKFKEVPFDPDEE
jgi:hypothetical protein